MDLPFDEPDEPETIVSRVLVVDDEPTVREVFLRLLSREQELSVEVAGSAEAAAQSEAAAEAAAAVGTKLH